MKYLVKLSSMVACEPDELDRLVATCSHHFNGLALLCGANLAEVRARQSVKVVREWMSTILHKVEMEATFQGNLTLEGNVAHQLFENYIQPLVTEEIRSIRWNCKWVESGLATRFRKLMEVQDEN